MSESVSLSPVEAEQVLRNLYELRSSARRLVRKVNWLITQAQSSRSQIALGQTVSLASVPPLEQLRSALQMVEASLAATRT